MDVRVLVLAQQVLVFVPQFTLPNAKRQTPLNFAGQPAGAGLLEAAGANARRDGARRGGARRSRQGGGAFQRQRCGRVASARHGLPQGWSVLHCSQSKVCRITSVAANLGGSSATELFGVLALVMRSSGGTYLRRIFHANVDEDRPCTSIRIACFPQPRGAFLSVHPSSCGTSTEPCWTSTRW